MAGAALYLTVLALLGFGLGAILRSSSPGLPRPRGLVTLRPSGPVRMRLTRRR